MSVLDFLLRLDVLFTIWVVAILHMLHSSHGSFKGLNHRNKYSSTDVSTMSGCESNPNYSWDSTRNICMKCPQGKYMDGYEDKSGRCYMTYSTLWWPR